MKICAALILFAFGAFACAADAPKTSELIGSWKLTKAISRGKEIEPSRFSNTVRTFDTKFFVVTGAATRVRARYAADEAALPKKIEVEYLDGPRSGTVLHGIYEVAGVVLKICVSQDGSAAPTRFESLDGTEVTLEFYERVE